MTQGQTGVQDSRCPAPNVAPPLLSLPPRIKTGYPEVELECAGCHSGGMPQCADAKVVAE